MRSPHPVTVLIWLMVVAFGIWAVPRVRIEVNQEPAVAQRSGGSGESGQARNEPAIHPDEIYARAARIASRSVVNIDTEKRVRVRGFFFDDDLFGPRFRRMAGSGSGVILTADGEIVTNEHVVGGAERIVVTLHDGRRFPGTLVGADRSTDVALVKVEAKGLPAAPLGSPQNLVPGQLAVAVGNPLGLRFTVTHGIVSALGRPVRVEDRVYENLIQTDCAINPGNSGGALVDREGKLIGINTLVADAANGVGFAIPIDTAQRIVAQLRKYGKVKRPWTGIYAANMNRYLQSRLGAPSDEGIIVAQVAPNSPADEAGIAPGDIVLELDGKKIASEDQFRRLVESLSIGKKVEIIVWREGRRLRGELTLVEAP